MKNSANELATASTSNNRVPTSPALKIPLHHRSDLSGVAKLALVVALVTLVLLVLLAVNVINNGWFVAHDLAFSAWLHSFRTPHLTQLMIAVSNLHSTVGILFLSAILLAHMKWTQHTAWLKRWVLVVPFGMMANLAVKLIVQRPRPLIDDALVSVTSFSFPSGHTTTATVFYGILGAYLLVLARSPAQRLVVVLMGLFMTALVAYSRIYLGAHYLSDVLASLLLGLSWLSLCVAVISFAQRRHARREL